MSLFCFAALYNVNFVIQVQNIISFVIRAHILAFLSFCKMYNFFGCIVLLFKEKIPPNQITQQKEGKKKSTNGNEVNH